MASSQTAFTPSIYLQVANPNVQLENNHWVATVTSLQWWLQSRPCTYASASDRAIACVASIELYLVLVGLDCMVSGKFRARAVLGTTARMNKGKTGDGILYLAEVQLHSFLHGSI